MIQQMSDALANRIAAGEVVERPASVLKELVENSLDAGAKRVVVTLRGAGISELVVEDDGVGMDQQDALACFDRHATSKLTDDAQLFQIRTLGFRGEALASIASVARVTLQTATEDGVGWEVICVPGEPPRQRPFSRKRGTRISVADLFFNTPARRQFLKTERGEAGAIKTWLSRLALANPSVAFTLRDERKERLRVSAVTNEHEEKARIEALLGSGLAGGLFCFVGEREGYSVRIFAARPDLSRRDRRSLQIYINGRFIDDRRLQQAVVEGFRSVLEVGRHPVAAVFLEIPPGLVDVNVHPQKTEVRLAQPRLVFSLIRTTLIDGLVDAPWLGVGAQEPILREGASGGPEPSYRSLPPVQRMPSTSVFGGGGGAASLGQLSRALPVAPLDERSRTRTLNTTSAVDAEPGLLTGVRYADLRPIGQVATTYLLLEGPSGLVVIDQHAAHERIVFGRLQCALGGERLQQQGLLIPVTLELDGEEAAELLAHRDVVHRFGFDLAEQDDALVVTAVPALLGRVDPATLLTDLAGALADGGGEAELERAFDGVIARLACHGSIRAGQRLSPDEIRSLMVDLDEAEHRSHCPHGRPFVVQFDEQAFERWFHRD
jgi:DNA mismatch repair protein MutL